MPGRNCAFFGCPTSQKHKLSLFQIPVVSEKQSEYTASIKKKTREEWLKIILRTREMTPELKTRIDNNNIYICELHFKPECIQSGKILICITSNYMRLYVLLCHKVREQRSHYILNMQCSLQGLLVCQHCFFLGENPRFQRNVLH